VVSTLVTVIGTATGAYSSWQASQQTAQQTSEALKKSQEQDLLTRVEYAKQLLPTCNLTSAERAEIDLTLTKAINELKINGDIQAAQALFDSVRERLVNCPLVTYTEVSPLPPVSYVTVSYGFLFVMALVSLFSAVAWRSERRRNKTVPLTQGSEPVG
jgi:hypothetical protein